MPKFVDLTGQKFNYLTVVEHAGRNHIGKHIYLCKCDCGNTMIFRGEDIKSGNTKSCGCMRRQMTIDKNYRHGFSKSPMYAVWSCVKDRISNPNNVAYKNYGGRGITLSEDWTSYENFHRDMVSTYKQGLTLERVNNEKGYCKENCIWATREVQCNNTRKNKFATYRNETLTVSQLARKYGISQAVLQGRIELGWDIAKAIETPVLRNSTYTVNGTTETIPFIAKRYGIKYDSLRWYLNKGESIEEAMKLATKI